MPAKGRPALQARARASPSPGARCLLFVLLPISTSRSGCSHHSDFDLHLLAGLFDRSLSCSFLQSESIKDEPSSTPRRRGGGLLSDARGALKPSP
jgi:hypothetical protein